MSEKSSEGFISVGRVKEAHGLKGEIYIKLRAKRADWIDRLEKLQLSDQPAPHNLITYSVEKITPYKEGLRVKIQGVSNRTEAEALQGKYLILPKSLLVSQPGENFFLIEIKGFEVWAGLHGKIGIVKDFGSNGPQDLLIIKGQKGTYEVPLVKEFIDRVDFEARKIFMNLPPGLVE